MKAKMIDGKLYKLSKVDNDVVTNQEHFEVHCKNLIDDFTCILPEHEIREFIENVLSKTKFRPFDYE